MGRAIAANLEAAGHEVRAWNRSGGAIDGVTMVSDPAGPPFRRAMGVQGKGTASSRANLRLSCLRLMVTPAFMVKLGDRGGGS